MRRVSVLAQRAIRRSGIRHYSVDLLIGACIGVVSGLGAVGFRWLIDLADLFFRDWLAVQLAALAPAGIILIPALGGVVVGLLVQRGAWEAKGSGVPQVLEAVAVEGGAIRARVAAIRPLATAVCVGSGGSAGREGPIVQIGSTLGSVLGGLVKARLVRRRTFVACGAAAGIAATFNAPLAGVLFAQEIILGEFAISSVAPLVVAAVTSAAIGYSAFGNVPAFTIPGYTLGHVTDLAWFVVLGALTAVVGVGFTRLLYAIEFWVDRLERPLWATAGVGGLVVGCIGWLCPQVMGLGYEGMGQVLTGLVPAVGLLLLLMALKVVATSVTLGSGGSGGIMAPSLFIGAMLGCAFGHVVADHSTTTAPAYGMVGMAALFSATGHAPISSLLTVFEMTQDYFMILPLMLACGVSTVLARLLFRFSIYNLRLMQHHVHYSLGRDTRLFDQITVGEAMSSGVITIAPEMSVAEAAAIFDSTKHHGFPIVGDGGRLQGMICISDVRRALAAGKTDVSVHEAGTHDLVVAFEDETLNDALRKLGLRDVGRLPVVARDDHSRLIGLVTRKNIIAAYNRALLRLHTDLTATVKPEHIE